MGKRQNPVILATCSIPGCTSEYKQYRPESTAHPECVVRQRKEQATARKAAKLGVSVPSGTDEDLRERVRLAQVEKDYISLRNKHSLKEAIGDRLVSAIKLIPELGEPKVIVRKFDMTLDEEEFWCDISDCQIGSKGNAKDTGGLSTYSYELFLERLERWKNAIIVIAKYHPNKVRVLNLAFLGDMIDGSQIFESQMRQVEEGAVQQVIFGVEHWCRVINELSAYFEVINCYGVVGNHGRIGKKGVSWIMDNLEYLMYLWMKDRLLPNARIHWEIPEAYWMVVERMGHRHLLIHGDRGVRGSLGIPFYGMQRFRHKMHELLRKTFDVGPEPFEFIHLGHFSQLAHFDDVFWNGSWDAGTELSVTEMVSGGTAYQWMLALHPTYGVSWSRRIFLMPKTKPRMKVYTGST